MNQLPEAAQIVNRVGPITVADIEDFCNRVCPDWYEYYYRELIEPGKGFNDTRPHCARGYLIDKHLNTEQLRNFYLAAYPTGFSLYKDEHGRYWLGSCPLGCAHWINILVTDLSAIYSTLRFDGVITF